MKNYKRIIFALLTIIWCLVIYSFSNATGDDSGGLSLKITQFIIDIIYPGFSQLEISLQTELLDIFHLIIRKLAHMTEYAILYFFVYEFISTYKKSYIIPLIYTITYAAFDEIHQLFINGRAGSFIDVCIDSFGALLMLGTLYIIEKLISKKKNSLHLK